MLRRSTPLCLCLALACAPRQPERDYDPVAPVTAQAAIEPSDLTGAPPRWSSAGAAATCMPDHFANMAMIPGTATMVAGVDAMSIVGSGTWAESKQIVEQRDIKLFLEIAQGCELGVGTWRGITFGGELAGKDTVMVLRADGIGRPERLECMRAAIERTTSKSPWTATASATELAFPDGGRGVMLDACTLVITTANWAKPVRDRMLGTGSSVLDGPLSATLARTDPRKPAWVAATLPSSVSTGSPFEGAKDVAGTAELTGGIALAASVTFGDPAEATKRAAELQQQFDTMKGAATSMGLPQPIVDSVRIVPMGAQVLMQATASDADLRALRKKVAPSTAP